MRRVANDHHPRPKGESRMTLEELEEIAKRFILGYDPLTDEQMQTLHDIKRMEEEREGLQRKIQRYDRVIKMLYIKLHWPESEEREQ